MVVDSSAIIAILNDEPDAADFADVMARAKTLRMSAATYVETAVVADNRKDPLAGRALDELLERHAFLVETVTKEQATIARAAYRDFGKGSGHPAQLNFGDCFAYALAKELREPLLFTGDDFGHTDIESAL